MHGVDTQRGEARGGAVGRTARARFWLDLVTAFVFAAMVSTGSLQRLVLPRGSGGTGLTWLGRGRHEWADVHVALGVVLLGLVAVHLLLHRSWIAACWRRLAGSVRSPVTWAAVALLAALLAAPFVIAPRGGGDGGGGWRERGAGSGAVERGP